MIIKIIAIVLAFIAIVLNFRVKWFLTTVFKTDSPSQDTILRTKLVALAIAVAAFLLVFLTKI